VIIKDKGQLLAAAEKPAFIRVKINGSRTYDLVGEALDAEAV